MFEQHPVPQQISSYQFRLVGDMTLKQFFQLAGGALISLIIYGSPLPGIFKWPLIIFFALGGAALAFLPIEDRPLDKWVVAFFRSIYSPTLFAWKSNPGVSVFAKQGASTDTVSVVPEPSPVSEPVFPSPQVPVVEPVPASITDTPLQTTPTKDVAPEPVITARVVSEIEVNSPLVSTPPVIVTSPTRPEIVVPVAAAPTITPAGFVKPAEQTVNPQSGVTSSVQGVFTPQSLPTTNQAQFSQAAAPPAIPTQANLIVGQAIDSQGEIIDGVILEIKDAQGRPVRALRSNKVGHFQTVTAIANGDYQLTAEKDGYDFLPVHIVAAGTIIEPVIMKGTKHA